MAHPDPEKRREYARLAANISWARTPVRSERMAPALKALKAKFLAEVPPEVTDPAERRKAAASARRAHYQRLALKSVEVRRRKSAQKGVM